MVSIDLMFLLYIANNNRFTLVGKSSFEKLILFALNNYVKDFVCFVLLAM